MKSKERNFFGKKRRATFAKKRKKKRLPRVKKIEKGRERLSFFNALVYFFFVLLVKTEMINFFCNG